MTAATRTVRVARVRQEALDICSFELVDGDGGTLPAFSAGAHIDVHLPDGLVRPYSLCNDPTQTHHYLIAVLRDPGSRGGSIGMHALAEGATLKISDPRNHFALTPAARHHLLLAGGIGVTPILCMAERLSAIGASFDMRYCTRSPERAAFVDRIRASAFAERVHFHFDNGPAAQRLDLAAVLAATRGETHLYVCGPTGFMEWVLNAARAAAWLEARLHREYFAAAPPDTRADGAFEVQIASTGALISVAADKTVAQALAAHGVHVETSCEQGVCGTCVTRILAGTPEHRDMYLTPAEQERGDQFTPCCSRSRSACLVLDL